MYIGKLQLRGAQAEQLCKELRTVLPEPWQEMRVKDNVCFVTEPMCLSALRTRLSVIFIYQISNLLTGVDIVSGGGAGVVGKESFAMGAHKKILKILKEVAMRRGWVLSDRQN